MEYRLGHQTVRVTLVEARANAIQGRQDRAAPPGSFASGTLQLPAHITLLPLPSDSPELNCVERVWLWMRTHSLSNRAFEDQAPIEMATQARCPLIDAVRIKSVCRTAWVARTNQAEFAEAHSAFLSHFRHTTQARGIHRRGLACF